ncbi:MAG: hypothetical protein GYA86_03620 [Firmicutes bacterium]|nr:hypothetical protein [Bacillota bacterium]
MSGLSASSTSLQQLAAFLEAAALGAIFAFCYDLYRAGRLQFRRLPPFLSVAADFLFWIAAAAAAIGFLVYRRWGEINIYIYIAMAGGFIGYLRLFSSYLLPLWLRGGAFIVRLFRRPPGEEKAKK